MFMQRTDKDKISYSVNNIYPIIRVTCSYRGIFYHQSRRLSGQLWAVVMQGAQKKVKLPLTQELDVVREPGSKIVLFIISPGCLDGRPADAVAVGLKLCT